MKDTHYPKEKRFFPEQEKLISKKAVIAHIDIKEFTMQNIRLLIVLILPLIPIYQLNAHADQPPAPAETSTQSPEPTIHISTTAFHESSPVRKMLGELIFKYETVYFETASYRLSPPAKQILKRKANWIKSQDPSKQIEVTGH